MTVTAEPGRPAPAQSASAAAHADTAATAAAAATALALVRDDAVEAINAELAALLHAPPVDLTVGALRALSDELVICGILGGKDVGKSTLINALASRDVSVDEQEVGEGTARPMAYVHRDAQAGVARRLEEIHQRVPIDVTVHQADAIRNVVLIDLPDFDSEFEDHLAQVREVTPLLDRVIWVMTPRKVGDRVWAEMFRRVIKDPSNVLCVLNKVDELLSDAEPFEVEDAASGNGRGAIVAVAGPHPRPLSQGERGGAAVAAAGAASADDRAAAFWRSQRDWLGRSLADAGCRIDDDRCFVISARFVGDGEFVSRIAWVWNDTQWSQYAADREAVVQVARLAGTAFEQLRQRVLGPVSADQTERIKSANRRLERRCNVEALRRHYDLDRTRELLAAAVEPEYHQVVFNEAFGPEYAGRVGDALLSRLRGDADLADVLLQRRVEGWPLLGLVYWLFGWLPRLLGRRYAAVTAAALRPAREGPGARVSASGLDADDPFTVGGLTLAQRIALIHARVLADHGETAERLGIDATLPAAESLADAVRAAAGRLEGDLESRLLDAARAGDASPRRWQQAGVWAVLLWFPLVQPVLEGTLEIAAASGTFSVLHGAYRVVFALGAARLLAGLAVVAAIYVVMLTGMYAAALRDIRRVRRAEDEPSPVAEAVDDIIMTHALAPIVAPLAAAAGRLDALAARLDDLDEPSGAPLA